VTVGFAHSHCLAHAHRHCRRAAPATRLLIMSRTSLPAYTHSTHHTPTLAFYICPATHTTHIYICTLSAPLYVMRTRCCGILTFICPILLYTLPTCSLSGDGDSHHLSHLLPPSVISCTHLCMSLAFCLFSLITVMKLFLCMYPACLFLHTASLHTCLSHLFTLASHSAQCLRTDRDVRDKPLKSCGHLRTHHTGSSACCGLTVLVGFGLVTHLRI